MWLILMIDVFNVVFTMGLCFTKRKFLIKKIDTFNFSLAYGNVILEI